jgi:phosphatidate cytidylyltransferase
MNIVFYCIVAYLVVGAVGMAVANRKETAVVRKQRWLKYFTYVLITAIIIASILLHLFHWIVLLIIGFGFYELGRIYFAGHKSHSFLVFIIYTFIAVGLWGFVTTFTYPFQLFIYFGILTFDAFSQITGQLFGRHPLLFKISPAKTVEGFLGGMFFCILSSLILSGWLNISLLAAFILGIITASGSFAGDILASYYKRKVQVKDYSDLLPGQGGFLDRFDSLLMSGVLYFLLYLLVQNTPFFHGETIQRFVK